MKVWKRFLVVLLVVAMAAGIWAAWTRYQFEKNNRRVEMAVDARLLAGSDFAGGGSVPAAAKLVALQEAGCTAVAVTPLSLNDLERKGEIVSLTPLVYIVTGDEETGRQMYTALSSLFAGVEFKNIRVRAYPLGGAGDEPPAKSFGVEKLTGGTLPGGLSTGQLPGGDCFVVNSAEDGARDGENNDDPHTATYASFSLPEHLGPAVKDLPLLFPREELLTWERAGLRSVPLFSYPARLAPQLSEKYWEVLARQLQEIGREEGLAWGPVAFPAASFTYPSPQGAAGRILQAGGLTIGDVEFTQGAGLQGLAAALDYRLLRAHQIPGAELAPLGELGARERFLRAVQERKIRLLLLQPYPEFDPRSTWAAYLPFVQNLSQDLQAAGFALGEASPFPPFNIPAAVQALLGAGVAAAALLLAGAFLEPQANKNVKKLFSSAGVLLILAVAGFLLAGERLPFYILGRQLAALTAALVFPLLSVVFFMDPPLWGLPGAGQNRGETKENTEKAINTVEGELTADAKEVARIVGTKNKRDVQLQYKESQRDKGNKDGLLWKLSRGLLLASLLTTGGALLAAGLLGNTAFLLKVESFRGVKIAQAGPFLLFGLLFLLQNSRGLLRAGRSFWEAHIKVKHLVVLALAGGVLLIYLVRGGNIPVLPVSSLELALRRKLELFFVARPRFKEFLIGHPCYFLLAALAARRLHGAKVLALLLGLLGQISLFNTFMHLHRPLSLSLWGTAYGIVLGLLGGLLFYTLARKVTGG
ncbi:MAG: hypothetical protein GX334_07760 [Firmicutes bacterium]|nr:hypothetical protein [Bacillota bacterium]